MVEAPSERFPSAWNIAGLLLLALVWGLSIPITKLGLESMTPAALTVLRFAIAVPVMFLCLIGRKPLPLRAMPQAAALGVLGIGIGQAAQAIGIAWTSASAATAISAMIPVFVVFFAALRLKQPVSPLQMLGLAAAFAGIVLVALESDGGGPAFWTSVTGAAFVLLSTVTIAFYYVWSVELTAKHGTTVVAAWSTLYGLLSLLPWAAWDAWSSGPAPQAGFMPDATALLSGAYLGLAVTVAGLYLWIYLLKVLPARIASSTQFLQPVIGVAAAALMFGDALGLLFVGGVILVLAGLALVMRPAARTAIASVKTPEM